MRIVQVMNALDRADAVSTHLLELDRMFREAGHETRIYSQHVHPDLAARRRPVEELPRADGDLLLFHYAGFSSLLGLVARFEGRRGVVYHNVTPERFFRDSPETFEFCRKGRLQVATLPEVFEFAFAVSEFNAGELRAAGFEHVRVLGYPWEASGLADAAPSPDALSRLRDGAVNLLMVGRIAPHKGAHHAVRALPAIQRRLGAPARLLLVGKTSGYESYVADLRAEAARLSCSDRIRITGEISTPELAAHYAAASALLVLSEHEGFCVPVAEAMAKDVPVIAWDAGATGETLGEGGVHLPSRDPEAIAEAVAQVARPGEGRSSVLEYQRERVRTLSRAAVAERLDRDVPWALSLPARPRRDAPLPSFSVVVCTHNRCDVLGECLEALQRLDYPEYEVVVVNGPSTDRTDEVLARFPSIKRVDNPLRNLSVSRNLGIAASAGEIVAFIDDDAVPADDWLRVLAEAYADPTVGGAGGPVYGPGGDHFQFDNGIISRWGLPQAVRDTPGNHNAPGGDWFNIVMGTNSSFRRSALEEVGGFDENYEYYHDESDLCVHVIRAGYRIEHLPDAKVWHEFAASRIRKNPRSVNWTVIVKNTIYFHFKVSGWRRPPWDWLSPLRSCAVHCGIFARWFVHGDISPGAFAQAAARWTLGVVEGYVKALLRPPRRHLARRPDERRNRFLRYGDPRRLIGRRPLRIALISQQYPPDECGGIGVYTERLAEGLVEAGHRVSVIASGPRDAVVWRHGVKVQRVANAPAPRGVPLRYRMTRRNLGRSFAVDAALRDLIRKEGVDVIEGPLWDAESFVPVLARRAPFVLRAQTPMAIAIETQQWRRTEDTDLACEMEWSALRGAQGVIDASGTILRTLAEDWGVRIDGVPTCEIPYGVPAPPEAAGAGEPRGDRVRVLFLGRLEPRKGIDVLAEAIPRVLEACPDVEFHLAGELREGDSPSTWLRGIPRRDASRVTFHGRVDDQRRAELYRSCDVFVAPSRYESFGIVYVEAMTYAKPVVACRIGGASRIVADGETGLLLPPGEAAPLAEAIVRLARDAGLRARLGREGERVARERYTVDAMVRSTIAFYERILDENGAGTPAAAKASGEEAGEASRPALPHLT